MKNLLFIIPFILILNACVPVKTQTRTVYPPTKPEAVEVFETPSLKAMKTLGTFKQSLPQKMYFKIADIPLQETNDIETIKKKAAAIGADAVIIIIGGQGEIEAAAIKYYDD